MKKFLSLFTVVALVALMLVARVPAVAGASGVTKANMCIVSLSPTATETLYAIGAGHRVEAVDTDSDYPTKGLPTKRIDPFNPNAEEIATICTITKTHKTSEPDLVVISYDANQIAEQLTALGIHVIEQDAPDNLAGAYAQITALGAATGHAKVAAAIVTKLEKTFAADLKSIPAHPNKKLTMYYELDPTLYSLTSATFVGAILKSMGVVNIADAVDSPSDYGYPQLTSEYVVTTSPKLVFLADTICCGVNAKNFAARPGFSTISAVKHDHIVGLNDDIASRWGPRLYILMNDLTHGVKLTLSDSKVWKK